MICPLCRIAGTLLRQGVSPDMVTEHHEKCKGGTWCDCAHKTESMNGPEAGT